VMGVQDVRRGLMLLALPPCFALPYGVASSGPSGRSLDDANSRLDMQHITLMDMGKTAASPAAPMSGSSPMMTTMKVYFHTDPTSLTLLVPWWTPDAAGYAVTLIIIFCIALFAEWATYRAPGLLIAPLEASIREDKDGPSFSKVLIYRVTLFLATALKLTLGFFFMLLAMSYDVGIVITEVTGLALGFALFADQGWFYGHAHQLGGPALTARADHTH